MTEKPTCAVCRIEPVAGHITVPVKGDFPIGEGCYRLHRGALSGAVRIADFARICTFRPDGNAANAWLTALIGIVSPIVSARIDWRGPNEERIVN